MICKPAHVCAAGLLGALLLIEPVWGQTGATAASGSATSAPAPDPQPRAKEGSPSPRPGAIKSTPEPQQRNGTSNDRLFWTLPNFLTVEHAHQIPPLTAGEKFKVVLRSTFDPVEYPYVGFLAGISQATDSEPGFGQGAAGYARRYGSHFADNTIENFITGAILPSALHQDPRYFQLAHGSFKHRLGYSISRLFVTRSDSRRAEFNASEVIGSGMSAVISTYSYHPQEDRTFVNTMSVWWTQMGWDAVAIGVKEFWPDIRRKVHNRRRKNDSGPDLSR